MKIFSTSRGQINWQAAVDHVTRGDVVRFNGYCDQAEGPGPSLAAVLYQSLRRTCGLRRASLLEKEGLGSLHTLLSASEIFDWNVDINTLLMKSFAGVIDEFWFGDLGYEKDYYVCTMPIIRFRLPHSYFEKSKDLYSERSHYYFKNQVPHLDSWFVLPEEAINLWVALTDVTSENGMLIYPDGEVPPFRPKDPDVFPTGYRLGRPVSLPLKQNDLLLFSGDILHGTALNLGDQTRVSATLRFFLGKPNRKLKCFAAYHRCYRKTFRTPLAPLMRRAGLLAPNWHETKSRWASLANRAKSKILSAFYAWLCEHPRLKKGIDGARTRLLGPKAMPAATVGRSPVPLPAAMRGNLERVGDISVVSASQCRVLTDAGEVEFSRWCPHQGADLAQGYLRNGEIVCAWHNVGFDLKTGASRCRSMGKIKVSDQTTAGFVPADAQLEIDRHAE